MVRIKRRRRNAYFSPWKIICLFALAAVAVRVISASGAEDIINSLFARIGADTDFITSRMAAESPFFNYDDGQSTDVWGELFLSQTPFYVHTRDTETEQDTDEDFLQQLTPWTFVPPSSSSGKKEFPIKAISINPQSTSGYTTLGKIFLKNDSSKTIDLNSYLKADMPFALKGDGPHVLIVHTHGSESYFPAGKYTYTPDDVERTQDKRYNVIRVGDEIEKILKEQGISVVHDRNIYDSPSYNGSYTRTLAAISGHMQKNPSIKVILDIHRDAMTTKEGVKYKTSATVNGKNAAQLMLVMSTGESGLPHPNWQENLKFAVKLQCQIVNKYPGLMRPINLRKERFNMHVTAGSMLVEVGTSANSMDEALTAIRPFSEELAALLKSVRK